MVGFKSFMDFLHMGGYAAYVWSAYGIALVVIAINILAPLKAKRTLMKSLQQGQAIQARVQDTAQLNQPAAADS